MYEGSTYAASEAPPPLPPAAGAVGKRVVKQGWVFKQGGASGSMFSRESWKKRWIVLEEKRLIWYEDPSALPKGEVYITGSQVEADPAETKKQKFSFAVR